MKKRILITLTLVTTFGLGFGFKSLLTKITIRKQEMKKATGIGGIFSNVKTRVK